MNSSVDYSLLPPVGPIRTREEAAAYANWLFSNCGEKDEAVEQLKRGAWSFGAWEVRLLLDFVYGQSPSNDLQLVYSLRSDKEISRSVKGVGHENI
jgi:hypothetical protein